MSLLHRLRLRGIRSYSDEIDEEIKFQAPLTIITGNNGCGKTSIIETLKFMLTEKFPESSNNKNFVHDPSIRNKRKVEGNMVLELKKHDSDVIYELEKRIEVNRKTASNAAMGDTLHAKKGTFSLRTYDLKTRKELSALQNRPSEVTECIANQVGNAAVLEHVLFTHQEDSDWPLGTDKQLKERFESIFDASQFNLFVEHLREGVKQSTARMREQEDKQKDLNKRKSDVHNLTAESEEMQKQIVQQSQRYNDTEYEQHQMQGEQQQLTGYNDTRHQIDVQLKLHHTQLVQQLGYLADYQNTQQPTKRAKTEEHRNLEKYLTYLSNLAGNMSSVDNLEDVADVATNLEKQNMFFKEEEISLRKALDEQYSRLKENQSSLHSLGSMESSLDTQAEALQVETTKMDTEIKRMQQVQQGGHGMLEQYELGIQKLQEYIEQRITVPTNRTRQSVCESMQGAFDVKIQSLVTSIETAQLEHTYQTTVLTQQKQVKQEYLLEFENTQEKQDTQINIYNELVNKQNVANASLPFHPAQLDQRTDFFTFMQTLQKKDLWVGLLESEPVYQRLNRFLQDLGIITSDGHQEVQEMLQWLVDSMKTLEAPSIVPLEPLVQNMTDLRDKKKQVEAAIFSVQQVTHAQQEKEDQLQKQTLSSTRNKSSDFTLQHFQLNAQVHDTYATSALSEKASILQNIARTLGEEVYMHSNIVKQQAEEKCAYEKIFLQCNAIFEGNKEFYLYLQSIVGDIVHPMLEANTQIYTQYLEKRAELQRLQKELELLRLGDGQVVSLLQARTKDTCICGTRIGDREKVCLESFYASITSNAVLLSEKQYKMEQLEALVSKLEGYRNAYDGMCVLVKSKKSMELDLLLQDQRAIENIMMEISHAEKDMAVVHAQTATLEKDIRVLHMSLLGMKSDHVLHAELESLEAQLRLAQEVYTKESTATHQQRVMTDRKEHILQSCEKGVAQCKTHRTRIQEIMRNITELQVAMTQVEVEKGTLRKNFEKWKVLVSTQSNAIQTQEESVNTSLASSIQTKSDTEVKISSMKTLLLETMQCASNLDAQGEIPTLLAQLYQEQRILKGKYTATRKEMAEVKVEVGKLQDNDTSMKTYIQYIHDTQIQLDMGGKQLQTVLLVNQQLETQLQLSMPTSKYSLSAAQERYNLLLVQKGEFYGQLQEKEGYLQKLGTKLQQLDHMHVTSKYIECDLEYKANQLTCADLQNQCKMYNGALNKYHATKQEAVNETLAELWQMVYNGKDITNIRINGEVDSNDGTKRQKFNYQVLMEADNKTMNMRGRCSAGQKMLACLLIRLALSEHFGSKVGVLTLDEPTAHMDKEHTNKFADALEALIERRKGYNNFQLLLITHDDSLAQRLARSTATRSYYVVSKNELGHSQITQVGSE